MTATEADGVDDLEEMAVDPVIARAPRPRGGARPCGHRLTRPPSCTQHEQYVLLCGHAVVGAGRSTGLAPGGRSHPFVVGWSHRYDC